MVVTDLPATDHTGFAQDFSGCPSMSTMQQPHCSRPQPKRVPISPSVLRRTSSSGVSSIDGVTLTRLPFTSNSKACVIEGPRPDWSDAELLAQDAVVEIVSGIEQEIDRDAVVHRHVDAADRAHLVVIGDGGDRTLLRLEHFDRDRRL